MGTSSPSPNENDTLEQIKSYYIFQKKIEFIIKKGYNKRMEG